VTETSSLLVEKIVPFAHVLSAMGVKSFFFFFANVCLSLCVSEHELVFFEVLL